MHITLLILAILGGAALWWYANRAARGQSGQASRRLGPPEGQKRLAARGAHAALAAIDDPVVAAATLLVAISTDDVPFSPERETTLREVLAEIADAAKVDGAVTHAKRAAGEIDEATIVIDSLAPLLASRLDDGEKEGVIRMLRRVATSPGPSLPALEQRVRRLKQKLGLQIA